MCNTVVGVVVRVMNLGVFICEVREGISGWPERAGETERGECQSILSMCTSTIQMYMHVGLV